MPAMREHLKNRRDADIYDFEHAGIRYRAIVGLYDDGRPGECFINAYPPVKTGTAVESTARDTAVALSLALQHHVPLETIRKAMTRLDDNSAAGCGGALLDLIPQDRAQLPS